MGALICNREYFFPSKSHFSFFEVIIPGIELPIYSSPIAFPKTTIAWPSFIVFESANFIGFNSPSNSIFITAKSILSSSIKICALIGLDATDDNFT